MCELRQKGAQSKIERWQCNFQPTLKSASVNLLDEHTESQEDHETQLDAPTPQQAHSHGESVKDRLYEHQCSEMVHWKVAGPEGACVIHRARQRRKQSTREFALHRLLASCEH